MNSIFARESYVETALFLSPVHLITIFLFLILLWFQYRFRKHPLMKTYGRWALVAALFLSEVSLIIWSIYVGQWDLRFNLPLQLCTISLYLCIIMLIIKQRFIFEIVYFFGLAGAFQAIVTPELYYTFPHYRFLHFFIAHFAIILAILHMVWVERMTITFRSMIKSFVALNIFALIAFLVNIATGANYMFLARKPENPSILDVLGPYPWYILFLEVIALLMFFILYLPFYVKHQKKKG